VDKTLEVVVGFEEKWLVDEKVSDHCGHEELSCGDGEDFACKVDTKALLDSGFCFVIVRGIKLL